MGAQRVTIIDDSPEILEVIGDALARDNVEVTLLGAATSLDAIAGTRPDVLMIDLRLGTDHLPGWQIIRQARSHPGLADIPIVVCSGALDQLRSYGGSAIGTRTYLLPKPFSLDDLYAVMAEAFGRQSAPDSTAISIETEPKFGSDPFAWFAWVDREMATPAWDELLGRIEPDTWVGPDGHPWRVVRTARGAEVRPELVSPFLRYGNQPMISAIGLSDEVEVELTTLHARWVDRFPAGSFDLAALGAAMLEERKLPHDNLPHLFPAERSGAPTTARDPYAVFGIGDESSSALRQ